MNSKFILKNTPTMSAKICKNRTRSLRFPKFLTLRYLFYKFMTLVQADQILRKKTFYLTKPATNFCDSSKSTTGVGLTSSKMARCGVSAGPSSINKNFKCLNTS